MGKPTCMWYPIAEYIGHRGEPGELNHLSSHGGKEINRDSESSGERNRRSLCVIIVDRRTGWERPAIEGDSPVFENSIGGTERTKSRAGHVKSCLKMGDHPPRLNTHNRPIVNQYREGKAKRTPGGSEIDPETACIQTVGASQWVTAYLLYNGSATYVQ